MAFDTSFSAFFEDTRYTRLEQFHSDLQQALEARFKLQRYGDWEHWMQAINALPELDTPLSEEAISLNQDLITVGQADQLSQVQRQQLDHDLRYLHPWRKGPFNLFGVNIDTEWRSDWKWQRIADHLSPLQGRTILDVGCGSGYHLWRMRGAGAKRVIGIDPSPKFLLQFEVFKRYMPEQPVHYLPLRGEDMPANMQCFDTVFSMGVLYHRRSPFEHLEELRQLLRPGGELVLETLVVEGDENTVLVPEGRYAQMRNVWCLPSTEALCLWLRKLGFENPTTVDCNQTSCEEQRTTDWMTFQSLKDFLDPENPNLTVEGLPAPKRATITAQRPGGN